MSASKENPIYSVYITSGGTKYNLTPLLIDLSQSEPKNQLAQSYTIELVNIQMNGKYLTSIIKARDRVTIYADDGTKKEEVFRGYVWERDYNSSLDGHKLNLRCYDNLIYFQESDDSEFFEAGKSTESVFSSLCSKWGIKLNYSYSSITHSKLALYGNLADIFTADLLDLVKDRTGKKYVILSVKDVMNVKQAGQNATVYTLKQGAGGNAIQTYSGCSMDGMVTKVIILGKEDDDDRKPVEGSVSGETGQYGTLQKTITRDSNTDASAAKKEAQNIIKEKGKPKWEYEFKGINIPWIRKGDKVNISAGDLTKTYLVTGIDRDISLKKNEMLLSLEDV